LLVGNSKVTVLDIERNCWDVDSFIKYSDSLIPEEFRSVQAIVDNQRYLNCLLLRKSKKLSFEQKNKILNEIMKNISIVGYCNEVEDISAVYSLVNEKLVSKYKTHIDKIY